MVESFKEKNSVLVREIKRREEEVFFVLFFFQSTELLLITLLFLHKLSMAPGVVIVFVD